MKKILYSALCVAALAATSCSDYLEVTSPSEVDADFVFSNSTTARAAMEGAYESWRDCAQNMVFGDGLFYALDVAGSDIERHPEAFDKQYARHWPETFYENGAYAGTYTLGSYDKDNKDGGYNRLFAVIGKANAVITAMQNTADFAGMMAQTEPTGVSQLYGEAIAMRATAYRELIKYYGDVPYQDTFGKTATGLASRDSIYEVCINDLIAVEPLMYPSGQIPGYAGTKNYFSKTYVQGLIGRMCLEAAGYQTRRGDITPVDIEGNPVTIEKFPGSTDNNGAAYGRRSDWQDFYRIAKTYYEKLLENSGAAEFLTVDPRANEGKRIYNNPYQYFFQEMHKSDAVYATESIYEYPMQQGTGGNDARSYSFGRVSSGGNNGAYPCKAYGQGRINPAYYYGIFDPNDMRRDVAVTVTGSDGKGGEQLIPFKPGSTSSGGGLSFNKWDENRQESPWYQARRKSGINGPYMRLSEIYLSYAEVCAVLGEAATAKQYLAKIRERAFPAGQAKVDEFITKCGSLLDAVIEERGFEFAGEGDRRWTLIRTGMLNDRIKRIKDLTKKMMDGLASDGYYEFENGNVISSHIYTKPVDGKSIVGFRLTAQYVPDANMTAEEKAVLFPGWRGQHDDWTKFGAAPVSNSNLAIKGLFENIPLPSSWLIHFEPTDKNKQGYDETFSGTYDEVQKKVSDYQKIESEKQSVEWTVSYTDMDGYTVAAWGADLVKFRDEYEKYMFYAYDYVKAPIYLMPFTANVMAAGGFTNGYGFAQEQN